MKSTVINPQMQKLLMPNAKAGGISDLYGMRLDFVSRTMRNKNGEFWQKEGEKMALGLFRKAAEKIPAYKDFLKGNNVKPSLIKSIKDFSNVPFVDKENYLRKYPLEKLCWEGKLENNTLLSVSSGSSGKPFFWPRGDNLEVETTITHAMIFKEFFTAADKSTLVINSFSMGIYIAGIITQNSALRASQLGMPITVISPGIEVEDILRIIIEVGGKYEQIILAGYPPFIKDIIDSGIRRGIRWKKYNIKFLFATENFSEEFRDYVVKNSGGSDVIHSAINIYGSADAGILAHETPISIAIRRALSKSNALSSALYGSSPFLPTFGQYNPIYKFFEVADEELLFSAYGGIPLIRYNIHDSGKVLPFKDVLSIPELTQHTAVTNLRKGAWKLPFVGVFGKSDLTISFYGLKIYPENIKAGLENDDITKLVSGRFIMEQKSRADQSQYWEINIELKEGARPTNKIRKTVADSVIRELKAKNLEYNRLHSALGKRSLPRIRLFEKGDKRYVDTRSAKHRWTKGQR